VSGTVQSRAQIEDLDGPRKGVVFTFGPWQIATADFKLYTG